MQKSDFSNLRFPFNTRIGIIGAGTTGLMVTEALKNKGYTEISILEREKTPGGKCKSVTYNNCVYELGAGFCTRTYKSILKLVKREGLHLRPTLYHPTYFSIAKGKQVKLLTIPERIRLPFELLKFFWLYMSKWRSIRKPGLTHASATLLETCKNVLEFEGLQVLHKLSLDPGTAFGYGRSDEVPAAYWLKYMTQQELIQTYFAGGVKEISEGFQELWKRVASHHNVHYGIKINTVKRTNSIVHVYSNQGLFQFDKLIITSPLDDALNFLDASAEERSLFMQIKTYDYRTYLCEVDNIPKTPGVDIYIPENYVRAKEGHPVFWYHRYKDKNILSFYVFAKPDMKDTEIEQNIANDIHRLGMRLKNVIANHHWKYFPHVSTQSMKTGFHSKMEGLQGRNKTYYAGEVLNFSSVKCCSDLAQQFVNSHF